MKTQTQYARLTTSDSKTIIDPPFANTHLNSKQSKSKYNNQACYYAAAFSVSEKLQGYISIQLANGANVPESLAQLALELQDYLTYGSRLSAETVALLNKQ